MKKLKRYNFGGDGGGTYTVKSGDTFYGIANKLGVSWSALKAANPNIDYDKLKLGQVLDVPQKESSKKEDVKDTVVEKVTQSVPSATDEEIYNDYFTNLRFQENSVNEGLKDGLYYPYVAVEDKNKKNPTYDIGFGNKLTAAEKIKYSKGITEAQAVKMMKSAFEEKKKYAANYIDGEYGEGTFEKLDPASQVILTDYQYNVRGGISKFKNFAKGVVNKDKDLMLKEYVRHSNGKPLGQRNTFTKDWINKYYEDNPKEQDGGYIDIELTDEEVEQYKAGGYVVEELPKANLGKIIKQAAKGSSKKAVSTTVKGTKNYIKNLNVKGASSVRKPLKLDNVSIPKSFKSEIDWGNWNKAIPNNKKLLQEYREIEYTTKLNGTWMKNVDGSPFQGMPEQFVQQQSKNFKKAFPNVYKQNDKVTPLIHHSEAKFKAFDESKRLSGVGMQKRGPGIYTIPKPYFDRYVTKDIGQLMNPTSPKKVMIGFGDHRYDLYANTPLGEFPLKGIYREPYLGVFPEKAPISRFPPKTRTYNTHYKTDPYAVVVPYSNTMKSAVGNDGMFNMANPDIYKALLPFIMGTGAASQMYNNEDFSDLTVDLPEANLGKIVKLARSFTRPKLPYPKINTAKLGSYPISSAALPTTAKGTKEYIKNFKPKKTLLIESPEFIANTKFDRNLAKIQAKESPTLTRNLNSAELDDALTGLKNENRVLSTGATEGRRTKHFSSTGAGAVDGGGSAKYNTTFIGNIDDIQRASGSHLRDLHPTDTYLYSADDVFKLTDEGVYITSDAATYEKLYRAGKPVRFEANLVDQYGNSNLEKFITTSHDESILKSYDHYKLDPLNRGSMIRTTFPNHVKPFESNFNVSGMHDYDILKSLEKLDEVAINPRFINEGSVARSLSKADNAVGEFGQDYSFFSQWLDLPGNVRRSELKKLNDFYKNNVKTGKVKLGEGVNLDKYKTDYKRVIEQLEKLHNSGGKPLRISQYRSKIKYKANELGFDNARIEHGSPIRMQGELDPLFRQRADVNQTVLKPKEKGFTLSESTGSSSSGTGIYFSQPEAWRHSLERGMPNTRTSSYARSPHGEGYLYQSKIKPDAVIVDQEGMLKILNEGGYTWSSNMYDIPKEAYDILRKEGVDIVVGGFEKNAINEYVVLNAKAVSKPKLTKKLDVTRYQVSYADGSMRSKQMHLPYADRGKVKLVDFATKEEAEAYVKKMGAKYDKTSKPVQWKSNRRYYNTPDAHRFEIKEVQADSEIFKKGGELRSYEPGGTQDEPTGFAGYSQPADEVDNPLQMWNLLQKDRWSGINENTSKGKSILTEYNNRMGAEYNPNDHWSAITISNAVMANTGAKNKDQVRALGFNPTKSHSGYVSDAFKTNADSDYKYNRYKAEKPGGTYSIGDIVVKGRKDGKNVGTSKWSYEDFASHDRGYVSHGDIVVDKGVDDQGEYVILAGGNLGNTYKNKKVYTKNLGKEYKVKLTDTKGGVRLTNAQESSNEQELYKDPFLSDFSWEPYGGRQRTTAVNPEEEYFQGYLNASSNPNAYSPPSLDTLGIGYMPYAYQFPTHLLEPEEQALNYFEDDMPLEVLQAQIDAGKNTEVPVEDEVPVDETDTDTETYDEEEVEKKEFKPKVYNPKTVYRTKYSDEDKNLVESIEEEIANLQKEELKEIQSIGASEMEAATTDEEKAAAKLKQFQSLMSMSGMTTAGDNKDEVEAITNKYKERRKALEEKLAAAKLSLDAKLLEENKITENQFLKANAPGYVEASKDFDKNIEKGLIWNSWSEEDEELLSSLGVISNPYVINGQYAYKGKENRANTEDLFQQEWLNNKDFGRIYGDGSLKYGQWITKDEYNTKMQEIANREYQRQQMDPYGMGQSGRVSMWYPELNLIPSGWGAKLANLAWEIGLTDNPNADFLDSYWATNIIKALGTSDFVSGAAQNVSDAFTTTFGKKKPGEKGYGEYKKALQRQKGADKSYKLRQEIIQDIIRPPSRTNYGLPRSSKTGGPVLEEMAKGGSVSEIWKERTGTSWSEAKAQGLTDGSYDKNIALRKRLLQGEFDSETYKSTPVEEREKKRAFNYAAYDKRVRDRVAKGKTLDDLVHSRLGTREGLISRFPDLFEENQDAEVADLTDKEAKKLRAEGYTLEETTNETPTTLNWNTPLHQLKMSLLRNKGFKLKSFDEMYKESLKPKGLTFNLNSTTEDEVSEEVPVEKEEAQAKPKTIKRKKVAEEPGDVELGEWAMTADLSPELQKKVNEIKNTPMGKAGELDYAHVVYELGRDALLKEYTPPNVEVEEDIEETKPYTDPFFFTKMRMNIPRYKSKSSYDLDKSFQENFDEFNKYKLFDLRSEEEKQIIKDSRQKVEDEINQLKELEKVKNKDVVGSEYGAEIMELLSRANQNTEQENSTPVYVDPITGRKSRDRSVRKLVDTPVIDAVADAFVGAGKTAGEYVDAAKGLPEKIYKGASKEITDAIEKLQKTSILPANIVKDIKTAANTAKDIYNTSADLIEAAYYDDKEAFLENKYGQEIALKILDQHDNPDKYYNLKFMNLNDDEVNFLRRKLEKEGRINTPEAIVKSVKERVVEVKPKPETFTEDAVDENGKVIKAIDKGYSNGPLYTYRNQWDNSVGFVYKTAPTKQHRRYSDEYTDVKGVAHFLLDASVDPKNPYSHKNNIAYIKKAKANNDWIPTFTKYSDDMVLLKYKKPADILETDIVNTPLRQLKFSDINFKSNQTPRGFKKTVQEVTTKDGDGTYLLFKNKDAISRFSGGSVVFIFEDEYGNAIVRDFAGSINAIQSEGNSITKQYNLEPGELTIGYHDVGSFSAKPKANKNNVLKASQWSDYNDNGFTGGALLIPTTNILNEAATKYDKQMSSMFPNTYNK